MEVRREDHQHEASSERLVQYLDRQGDWLEKTRGDLIVAASIIAAMSFQVMVNPPGGVWQEDQKCSSGEEYCSKAKAGTAIFAHDGLKRVFYLGVVISSTISFSSSMSLILLVISGFRLRNRIIMVILAVFMVGAVLCIAAAFCFAVAMVQSEDPTVVYIVIIYVGFWIVFPILILLIQLVRLLIWFICCCRRQQSLPRLLPLAPLAPSVVH